MPNFTTPLSNIRQVMIYPNPSAKTMATIQSEQGAHGICNGTLFNSSFQPIGNALWIDGVKKVAVTYFDGYEIGSTLTFQSHTGSHTDYIGGFSTFNNGNMDTNPNVNAGPRMGFGIKGSNMFFYHWTANPTSFTTVKSDLTSFGAQTAIMLDGGNSIQYNFGSRLSPKSSATVVANFVLFYFKDQAMPVRSQGSSGPVISYMQKLLRNHGFTITVDGVFGTATTSAITAFNAENGRSLSSCDATTWQQLGA